MRNRIAVLLTVLAVMLFLTVPISAQELPDPQRTGSLTLWLAFDGHPLDGGSLTLYRVGELSVTDGNAGFLPVRELEGGPALTELNDPGLARELAALAQSRNLSGIQEEILMGWVTFAPLEPGLYVVTQKHAQATEGFDAIQPFLISLPRWEDGSYVYDLTAAPKVPLVPEETPPPPSEPTTPPPSDPPGIPQTGQLNWPIPVLAAAGMTLFILGWALYSSSGRKHHDT